MKPSGEAIRFVTSGTYNRQLGTVDSLSFTSGTEYEVGQLSDWIAAAAAQDELFSWVRFQSYIWSDAEGMVFEWMVIRCEASDALQNMDASSSMELWQKEKRIYARGVVAQPRYGYAALKPIKGEFFNVKLHDTEELRLVIKPWSSTTAAQVKIRTIVEYRQVGV